MKDLQTLSQLQKQLAEKPNLRHHQSESLYQQGKTHLRQALDGNLEGTQEFPDGALSDVSVTALDRQYLLKAVDCFAEGIRLNYRNAHNYVGMGFLLILTSQKQAAEAYLQTALGLNPDLTFAHDMLRHLSSGAANDATDANLLLSPLGDLSEEEVEERIQAFLKILLSDELRTLTPTPEQQRWLELQQRQQNYQEHLTALQKAMQQIDRYGDASKLQRHLFMIENVLKQMEQQLCVMAQFVQLAQLMAKEQQDLQRWSLEAMSAQDLEILLDTCDRIADQLDGLESQGHDIAKLLESYHGLIEAVEELQETLDG